MPSEPPPILDLDHAPKWLRISEAARFARISTRTIRRWISIRILSASKPGGGRVLVDRDSLRAVIDNGRL